jgi:hypothetical protein
MLLSGGARLMMAQNTNVSSRSWSSKRTRDARGWMPRSKVIMRLYIVDGLHLLMLIFGLYRVDNKVYKKYRWAPVYPIVDGTRRVL